MVTIVMSTVHGFWIHREHMAMVCLGNVNAWAMYATWRNGPDLVARSEAQAR